MTMDTAFREHIMKFLESQTFHHEYLSRTPLADSYSGMESFSAAKSRMAEELFNQPIPPMTQAQIDAIMNGWDYARHWVLPVEAPCTEWDIL